MLGASDGQPVEGVVGDHLGDGVERFAELAEDDLSGRVALDAHVHKAPGRPNMEKNLIILSIMV